MPDAGKFEGWTATRFNLFAPSWNTTLIDGVGGPPKTWEDLADPRFDGKLAMEVGDYDWYLTLYGWFAKQGKSEAEIDKIFADMAKGAKIVKGHTVQGELLSAGQFAIVASNYTYLVEQVKTEGRAGRLHPAGRAGHRTTQRHRPDEDRGAPGRSDAVLRLAARGGPAGAG